jgi:hypothetical protein
MGTAVMFLIAYFLFERDDYELYRLRMGAGAQSGELLGSAATTYSTLAVPESADSENGQLRAQNALLSANTVNLGFLFDWNFWGPLLFVIGSALYTWSAVHYMYARYQ